MIGQAKSKPESARGGQRELLFGTVKPRKRRQKMLVDQGEENSSEGRRRGKGIGDS